MAIYEIDDAADCPFEIGPAIENEHIRRQIVPQNDATFLSGIINERVSIAAKLDILKEMFDEAGISADPN